MTAVVAVRVNEAPVLVGDVVLSSERGTERLGYAPKIYRLRPGLALGWSGYLDRAQAVLRRLDALLPPAPTRRDVERAFAALSDLKGGNRSTELTGWLLTRPGPWGVQSATVVRWATGYDAVPFSDAENSIGDGGSLLRKMMATPSIRAGNSAGTDTTVLMATSGFVEARFEELGAEEVGDPLGWPKTWGAAFDLLSVEDGVFRWLPSMTYIRWKVAMVEGDKIVSVTQSPTVFKQQRVHSCTVMQTKRVGETDHKSQVSWPILLDEIDERIYARRDFSARSPWYANYFQVFHGEEYFTTFPLVLGAATGRGIMAPDDVDEATPQFRVNVPLLEEVLGRMLRERRSVPTSDAGSDLVTEAW